MRKLLPLFLLLAIPARAQIGQITNPLLGSVNVQDAGVCSTPNSFLTQQLPQNPFTTTVNLAGTFSATVTIRESNNGGATWATVTTATTPSTTAIQTSGFTHVCADVTAFTSGVVNISITTGIQTVNSIVQGSGTTIVNGAGTSGQFIPNALTQRGLTAEYRILAGESASSLKDYSGTQNNVTGTTGTAPVVGAAPQGGLTCAANGNALMPAGLNGSLTIEAYVTFQPASAVQTTNSIIFGNNNPAGAGLVMFNGVPNDFSLGTYDTTLGVGANTQALFAGTGFVAATFGTTDQVYVNGQQITDNYASTHPSAGINANPFAICGLVSLGGFTGKIYWVAMKSVVATPQEIYQDFLYAQNLAIARGITPGLFAADQIDTITIGGESIAALVTVPPAVLTINGTSQVQQVSQTGYSLQNSVLTSGSILNFANYHVDPLTHPNAARNALILFNGATNDMCQATFTAAQTEAATKQYIHDRKAYDPVRRVFVVSVLSRTACDATRDTFNTVERANWKAWGFDGFIDIGGTTNLGADGSFATTTSFSDSVHPTTTSNINTEDPMLQAAVNQYWGNTDFSSATTYASAAAAAVATTAVTQSTNTVTVTMVATPANCQVGNMALVTGVTAVSGTATGYNATAANGAGLLGWMILTRSATQITYYDGTTGLGAASVQGTVVCPQQQDADVDLILNFGAGNFSLQPAAFWVDKIVCIRNINAVASTLVPWGVDTITGIGAASTTLAATATACLHPQLISTAAGGWNWLRSQ